MPPINHQPMRFTILLLLFTFHLTAQSNYVYPVRENHRWGYVTGSGKTVVEAKYDAVSDRNLRWHGIAGEGGNSAFRLVEADGKLGLLDSRMQEILAPAWRSIRPLSDSLFAVAEDSLFTIVNRQGERVLSQVFEDVTLFSPQYFKVKKGSSWGVYRGDGVEILPIEFYEIGWFGLGAGFFKIKKTEGGLWGLVNHCNEEILPQKFTAVLACNEQFFAVIASKEIYWEAWDARGERFLEPEWAEVIPLNRQLTGLRGKDGLLKIFLQNRRDTLSLPENVANLSPFDERFVRFHLRFTVGLLDSLANPVVPPVYSEIERFNDTLLLVRRSLWGLLSLRNELVLPCNYDSIGHFENGLAVVKKDKLLGLIDDSFQEVIPCYFDRLSLQDSIVKAWDDGKLTIFKTGENGAMGIVGEATNVRTLRIGFDSQNNFTEAQPVVSSRTVTGLADDILSPFSFVENTPWQWRRDPQSKLFALFGSDGGGSFKPHSPPIYRSVFHIGKVSMSIAFAADRPVVKQPEVLPVLPFDTLCRMALFSHTAGKFISGFDYLGLRGEDFDRGFPLAAFIDLEGKMGLMDRQGTQVKGKDGQPFRAAWIGEFFEGKARFCVKGRLAVTEEPGEEKYGVIKVFPFVKKFGITSPEELPLRSNKIVVLDSFGGQPPLWGYLDTLGRVAIEPKFEFASDFSDGLAINQSGGQWGVIDAQGKTVLDFKYRSVSRFFGRWRVGVPAGEVLFFDKNGRQRVAASYRWQGEFAEGLCRVQCDSLWGFMDETGVLAVPCRFEEARDFSEGLAAVRQGGRWFFIKKNGETAFETAAGVTALGDLHEGRCRFKKDGLSGYLNRRGEVAIEPKFTVAFDFQQGVARAVQHRKTGLVDTLGQWVLPPERFERIADFNELGLAAAWEKFNQKCCLLRTAGKALTPLKYTAIEDFHEGFATVSDGKNYGLTDREGREVLPLEFERIGRVSGGLVNVRARYSSAWQFYDTLGQVAFPGKFDIVSPFSWGLAEVQVNHFDPTSKIVIDRTGKQLSFGGAGLFQFYGEGVFGMWTEIGEEVGRRKLNFYFANLRGENMFDRFFEKIEPYAGGVALVRNAYRWGVLNRNGLFVIPAKHPFLNRLGDGSFSVRQTILFGITGDAGNEIIPPLYDRIELMEGDLYRLENGEKIGYTRLDGTWVKELKN